MRRVGGIITPLPPPAPGRWAAAARPRARRQAADPKDQAEAAREQRARPRDARRTAREADGAAARAALRLPRVVGRRGRALAARARARRHGGARWRGRPERDPSVRSFVRSFAASSSSSRVKRRRVLYSDARRADAAPRRERNEIGRKKTASHSRFGSNTKRARLASLEVTRDDRATACHARGSRLFMPPLRRDQKSAATPSLSRTRSARRGSTGGGSGASTRPSCRRASTFFRDLPSDACPARARQRSRRTAGGSTKHKHKHKHKRN